MKPYLILLAGGSGRRMGLEENKVFVPLRGVPAIVRALAPFTALCEGAVVVTRAQDQAVMRTLLTRFGFGNVVRAVVDGGADRQASVANGLRAIPEDAEMVLVHDGARALVTEEIIERAIESAQLHGSGVAAIPVTDTIKRASPTGAVLQTLERSELHAMQTPQAFRTDWLRQAHQRAELDGYRATDDAALLEHAGLPVYLCLGDRRNLKLTTPFDVKLCETILGEESEA